MTGLCPCGCGTVWTLQTHQRPDIHTTPDRLMQRVAVDRPAPTLTAAAASWKWIRPGTPHTDSIADRP